MRQVIYSAAASLDGFIARPNGSADWIPSDPDVDFVALFQRFDTVFLGRKTHEEALKTGGLFSGLEAFVFSRSRPAGRHLGVEYYAKPPLELVLELRKHPGKDLWLMGGGDLAAEFLRADLVDGIQVAVCPVLLGSGIPMFGVGGFPERQFRLASHRLYEKSGIMMLDYERA